MEITVVRTEGKLEDKNSVSREEKDSKSSGKSFLAPAPKKRTRGKKVPLAPGHSHIDWMRVQSSAQAPKPRKLSRSEVRKHKTEKDLWMVIKGKVYDVTSYVAYHPGGVPELLKGAGKDATKLFASVHPWVNVDVLLAKCCVGIIDTTQK
ncbi:hypothetical protein AAMO2058_001749700 [Amorphochlora amoebiformis]